MNTRASRELIRGTAVAIGAWLIVIAAAVHEQVGTASGVVPVNYRIE